MVLMYLRWLSMELLRGVYTSPSWGDSDSYSYMLYGSGDFHHVAIGPLEANKTYFHRCGGYGPEYSFKTPPAQFPFVLQ